MTWWRSHRPKVNAQADRDHLGQRHVTAPSGPSPWSRHADLRRPVPWHPLRSLSARGLYADRFGGRRTDARLLPLLVLSSAVLAVAPRRRTTRRPARCSVADSGLFACPATLATACEDVVADAAASTGDLRAVVCDRDDRRTLSGSCGGYTCSPGRARTACSSSCTRWTAEPLRRLRRSERSPPQLHRCAPGFALPTTCSPAAPTSAPSRAGRGPGCVESDGGRPRTAVAAAIRDALAGGSDPPSGTQAPPPSDEDASVIGRRAPSA